MGTVSCLFIFIFFVCKVYIQFIGSVLYIFYIPLFNILALFKSILAFLDGTCMSCYMFSESFKFEVFETKKN